MEGVSRRRQLKVGVNGFDVFDEVVFPLSSIAALWTGVRPLARVLRQVSR